MSRINLTIDGRSITAEENETILQVASRHDIYIPHLCHHPDLDPVGVCRLCFVDVDSTPVLSCKTKVENGMKVKTTTPEIEAVRRTNIEVIVANHHATCKGCSAIGKCTLQKLMGHIHLNKKRVLRLRLPAQKVPLDTTNPYFDYDPNKCVLCEICLRTCKTIQDALFIVGRGYAARIAFYGDASRCKSCYQCVARCPVGALIQKNNIEPREAVSST